MDDLIVYNKAFKSFFENNVIPSWYKRVYFFDGKPYFRVAMINPAYTVMTGIAPTVYLDQPDDIAWENNSFSLADEYVFYNEQGVLTEEVATIRCKKRVYVGAKWPDMDGRKVQGIWGQAIGYELEDWKLIRKHDPRFIGEFDDTVGGFYPIIG